VVLVPFLFGAGAAGRLVGNVIRINLLRLVHCDGIRSSNSNSNSSNNGPATTAADRPTAPHMSRLKGVRGELHNNQQQTAATTTANGNICVGQLSGIPSETLQDGAQVGNDS
jgi:hypothetical protein